MKKSRKRIALQFIVAPLLSMIMIIGMVFQFITVNVKADESHNWSTDWAINDTHHWHECNDAGCDGLENSAKDGYAPHVEDSGIIKENESTTLVYKCIVCQKVLREEKSYDLWVNNTQVTSQNAGDILSDNTASYDPINKTLTLDNANILDGAPTPENQDMINGILSGDDLNIILKGTNTIGDDNKSTLSYGIQVYGNLSIVGEANSTLNLILKNSKFTNTALRTNKVGGLISIENANIEITGINSSTDRNNIMSITSSGSLIIKNSILNIDGVQSGIQSSVDQTGTSYNIDIINSKIHAIAESALIYSHGNIHISGGLLNLEATGADTNAIYSKGNLTIEDKATLFATSQYPALYATTSIKIVNSTIDAESKFETGIFTPGNISILNESNVTANGYYPGIMNNQTLTISDSKVHAISTNDSGIWSRNNLVINGNSNVISNGIGASKQFTITPANNQQLVVKTGTSMNALYPVQGSPFSTSTVLQNYNKDVYFSLKQKDSYNYDTSGSYTPKKEIGFVVKNEQGKVIQKIKTADYENLKQLSEPVYFTKSNGNIAKNEWIVLDQNGKFVKTLALNDFKKQYSNEYKVYLADKDGKLVRSWKEIEGNWYYFNDDYTAKHDSWIAHYSDWYYFSNYGFVTNQWVATSHGRWYYLDNEGKMVRNQWIDGYFINELGIYWSPVYSDPDFIASYQK